MENEIVAVLMGAGRAARDESMLAPQRPGRPVL